MELMIGNYLIDINYTFDVLSEFIIVETIQRNGQITCARHVILRPPERFEFRSKPRKLSTMYGSVSQIPITDGWLHILGFKKGRLNSWRKESSKGIFIYHDNHVIFDGAWIECKYVHQLQNLYYTLTGEKLRHNDCEYSEWMKLTKESSTKVKIEHSKNRT